MGKKKKGGRGGCLWMLTAALFICSMVLVTPTHAALQDMSATVYKWEGKANSDGKMQLEKITSGITFKVLAHGSNTAETLYVYGSSTSLTNAVSTTNFASSTYCNKQVRFRVDPTDTTDDRYVDVIVVDTDGGYTAVIDHFDKYTHTIVIDERPGIQHHGTIWWDPTTTDETSTGVAFQAKTVIHDVGVEVVTVASAKTIDVGLLSTGTGGATAGFRSAVLTTAAGMIADTAVITNSATTIDYYPASTYGTLLVTAITGTGASTSANGGRTYLQPGYYHNGTSTGTLTYHASSTTCKGYLHYWFTKVR